MSPLPVSGLRPINVSLPFSGRLVFRYLADIENLPRWADSFCERLDLTARGWRGWTTCGDLFIELTADERLGVVDIRIGAEHELLAVLALRVLDGSPDGCIVNAVLLGTTKSRHALEEQFAEALRGLVDRVPVFAVPELDASRVA